jgi:hypothetical protein
MLSVSYISKSPLLSQYGESSLESDRTVRKITSYCAHRYAMPIVSSGAGYFDLMRAPVLVSLENYNSY